MPLIAASIIHKPDLPLAMNYQHETGCYNAAVSQSTVSRRAWEAGESRLRSVCCWLSGSLDSLPDIVLQSGTGVR